MSVLPAYLGVVLIWTTTPLAIQWSGDGPGFLFGVAARMLIGLCLLLGATVLFRTGLPLTRVARKAYGISGVTIYVTMTLIYGAAQLIPSGWVAVILGLVPIFTGLFSVWILKAPHLQGNKLLGVGLGVCGLLVVFSESLEASPQAWMGILIILAAAAIQAAGAVLMKALKPAISSFCVTTGGIFVATVLCSITCLLGQDWPTEISERAFYSIVYLGIFGSAIGFTLYYYVLQHTSADAVALITMITPVMSLILGAQLNGEDIAFRVWIGAGLIVFGLGIYVFGRHLLCRSKILK